MTNTRPKLFLLDAMALIYRAFFALNKNPRINSKGLNTSAILGFANTLYEILKNEKPTHIGVAIDTMAPTQRHTDFAAYKANREKMPDDLALSIPYIIELIKGFNIPLLLVDGYEADDVIGTLAKEAEKSGFITYMMTPDKDFGQLVSENIFMYKPARSGEKAVIWGVEEVCERYGIQRPKQLIDILGLMGDASDNIPGVAGVGEKTAIKLIAEYGSIENLLQHTSELKGKLKENVETHKDMALQSKQLATIITDVPIAFDPDALKTETPDIGKLKQLFDELEFRNFAKRLFGDALDQTGNDTPGDAETVQNDLFSELDRADVESTMMPSGKNTIHDVPHHYESVTGEEAVNKLVNTLLEADECCFDTETTNIDAHTAELVGMSFAIQPHHAWFVPLPENYHDCQQLLQAFKPFFENESILKIGQNLKYDISVLRWYEIEVKGPLFDTMIAHYLIEPDQRHNMDFLAETYLAYSPVAIESLIGKKGKNQGSMRDADVGDLKEYAAEDADITLQLKHKFDPLLDKLQLRKLFEDIEMPLVRVLASMEAEGVNIDAETLKQIGDGLEKEIILLEEDIYKHAGTKFNIASPKQLGDVLFERLGLTTNAKKTKTGQYPTGEEVLSKMIHAHPIIEYILDYRSLTKLKSTYVDTLPLLANPRDGRIHTSYNQAVASTGRLSSNNPNLQNIPIRTERGREIRKAFVPRNNQFTLVAADYSQIELRIIAHLSGDKDMIDAFNKGLDIHTATAAKVYNVVLKDVTKEMRRNAKMVNFGIIYGISAFGLSERLGISRGEAANIISNYFREYQGIKMYMTHQIEFARKNGFVETMLGRRRMLRDINVSNSVVRGFAERNAINAPIQGSSADMIKIAMISIHNVLAEKQMQSKMILQVHDELVFDAHHSEIDELKKLIEKHMKEALPLSVPVEVEVNTGENWLEAH
ncbi:MAG: DNA polymerase I [Bacteroidetes bacterium HGW-Bacteroidetes-1]|jgi:DNA polymerase-1|nr:MAG: DNA polymerase I [Bacteroidetes bacterium HGW-Bacteroidetes-1]